MEIFVFAAKSRLALGSTQPPIQWTWGFFPSGVKWPGCEADHSSPSSAGVKKVWSNTSTHPICLNVMVLNYEIDTHLQSVVQFLAVLQFSLLAFFLLFTCRLAQ
jgi:hypothetical protein